MLSASSLFITSDRRVHGGVKLNLYRGIEPRYFLDHPAAPVKDRGLRYSGLLSEDERRKRVFGICERIFDLEPVDELRHLRPVFLAADMQAHDVKLGLAIFRLQLHQ